jgi:hypothetical protein
MHCGYVVVKDIVIDLLRIRNNIEEIKNTQEAVAMRHGEFTMYQGYEYIAEG